MIHVAYGLHDKTGHYSKFTGTSILSMFENNYQPPPSVTVHLLHDNTLTRDNYEKFVYLSGRYNQIIKFYNVEKLLPDEIDKLRNSFTPDSVNHFTVGATFRLLMGKFISADIVKIIYIDSDTIINLDINGLWQIELGDKILGAVPEIPSGTQPKSYPICKDGTVKPEIYFNSGILLINLEKWRNEEDKIMNGVKFVTEKKYPFIEQEALNYCYSENYFKLPRKFNIHVRGQKRFSNTPLERTIYHYLGRGQSLSMDFRDKFNRLWFSYFAKTPWFNEDTIENIYNGVKELYVDKWKFFEQQQSLWRLSSELVGKSRVFVTASQTFDALKQFLYVREDEEFFKIDSSNWFENLVAEMKNSVGKKIYFMLTGGLYPQLRTALMQMRFVEWRDFINAEMFLMDLKSFKLDSYKLIEKM